MKEIIGEKFITEKEASKRYGYSTYWFQQRRHKHMPPSFMKRGTNGAVYYPLEETDNWFKEYNTMVCY